MINVIAWAIMALLIYAGLKAIDAKVNGIPFMDGLSDETISQKEALLVACLAPLGTLFAIGSVLYLFFNWDRNPFEMIVQAVTKWVKEAMGIVDAVVSDAESDS